PGVATAFRCGINALSALVPLLPDSRLKRRWASQLEKGRNHWLSEHLPAYYRHRMSIHKSPELYLSKPEPTRDFFDDAGSLASLKEDESCLSYLDLNTYLTDDILVKVDR